MIDLDTLFEPFRYSFMIKAFIISFVISIPTSLLSCFLVLKGWALLGDAISHAVLPGIILAFIFNIPLLFGAFVSGLLCAVLTGYISNNCRVKPDTVMGVLFFAMIKYNQIPNLYGIIGIILIIMGVIMVNYLGKLN